MSWLCSRSKLSQSLLHKGADVLIVLIGGLQVRLAKVIGCLTMGRECCGMGPLASVDVSLCAQVVVD